jgi:hypothetical protein
LCSAVKILIVLSTGSNVTGGHGAIPPALKQIAETQAVRGLIRNYTNGVSSLTDKVLRQTLSVLARVFRISAPAIEIPRTSGYVQAGWYENAGGLTLKQCGA